MLMIRHFAERNFIANCLQMAIILLHLTIYIVSFQMCESAILCIYTTHLNANTELEDIEDVIHQSICTLGSALNISTWKYFAVPSGL